MSIDLSTYQAVLLDLDGTVYHEEHALPGAVDLLLKMTKTGQKFACLSNSTSSPLRIAARLNKMGVDVAMDKIYTAAAAAVDYVLQKFGQGGARPKVYNLSTEGVHEMLDGTVNWVQTDAEPCDAVIIGAPANVYATEERQRMALRLLRKGTVAVGICQDRVYPSPRGLELGAGALSMMLGYAANNRPVFCGKPQKIFFQELCRRISVPPEGCVLVGDNMEADVLGAEALGMKTILTLTGVTRRRDLLNLKKEKQPDYVVEDLTELL